MKNRENEYQTTYISEEYRFLSNAIEIVSISRIATLTAILYKCDIGILVHYTLLCAEFHSSAALEWEKAN